jgi:hypothetical protein
MDVCVCSVCVFFFSCLPRVEAGKNTSTEIPASRKRRQKGNPVVPGETAPADLRKRLMKTYHWISLFKVIYIYIYIVSKLAYRI